MFKKNYYLNLINWEYFPKKFYQVSSKFLEEIKIEFFTKKIVGWAIIFLCMYFSIKGLYILEATDQGSWYLFFIVPFLVILGFKYHKKTGEEGL